MELPAQGGLGAASQALQPKPPAAFNADRAQAENVETQTQSRSLSDASRGELEDTRNALNNATLQLRQSADARKNITSDPVVAQMSAANKSFGQTPESLPTDFSAQKINNFEEQNKILEARRTNLASQMSGQNRQMFDPALLQMAAGFLKPTKTGSFGESAGYAAENLSAQNERDYARKMQEQKMMEDLQDKQFAFRQQINESNRQAQVGKLTASIYTPVKDAEGLETFKFNPVAAQQLAGITGDINIVKQIVDEQRKQRLQEASNKLMTPLLSKAEDGTQMTSYKINPEAVKTIMSLGGADEVTKIMKTFGEMRKFGLVGDMGREGTPFDAIIAMNPSLALTDQAKRLAQQYSKGIIDEDKANALAQQMITVATSHMDRVQANAFQQSMAQMQYALRVSTNQMALERHQDKMAEALTKLSPQEKIDYKERVLPILKKGESANEGRDKLNVIKEKFATAPEGVISGMFASSIGKLFNTDEATALRQIDQLTKDLMPNVPRLPGAASNFDAKNILEGLGNLADPKLTNERRYQIIKDLDDAYKRIANRASEVEQHWEQTKKVLPFDSEIRPPDGRTAPSSNKQFKVIGTEPAKAK